MAKEKDNMEKAKKIFQACSEARLVYLFGSRAKGDVGPLSDYDFAVYFNEKTSKQEMFDLKFSLEDKLSREFKTNKIDIVILNLTESPELKYNIIKEGKIIYEVEPYRVIVEPKILNSYFDFIYSLRKNNLTKS